MGEGQAPPRSGLRPRRAPDGGRRLVVIAGLVVLLGAVALTAGMARPDEAAARGLSVPPQALIAWGMAVAVVAGLALSVLGPFWSRREKWVGLVLGLLLLLGFAILAERQHPLIQQVPQSQAAATPPAQQAETPAPSQPQVIPPKAGTQAPAGRGPGTVAPWVVALIGGAALLGALLVLRTGRGGGGAASRSAAADLGDAVSASLADVATETDARRAIVAAWIGMGDALARHGLRREPHEAPLEYMRRALRAVQVSARSAQQLTALFERARYSDHPATPAMRDEALAALQDVRAELRDNDRAPR
jgi:hypothetical protein